jgi:hypothetical protein
MKAVLGQQEIPAVCIVDRAGCAVLVDLVVVSIAYQGEMGEEYLVLSFALGGLQ